MEKNLFLLDMQVRAYECDFQGIVNNAVYMNYLEHARMCFGKEYGICVVELAKKGIVWVVSQVKLAYVSSLEAGDHFQIATSVFSQGVMRVIFEQEIRKKETNQLVLNAEVTTACIVGGRPVPFPGEIKDKFIG